MRNDNRQGFLEPELSLAQAHATIGVVGLSGGGSHIVQQLAHLGFTRYALYDPKIVESKHLHRMAGATLADAEAGRPKVEVAERVICGLHPAAEILTVQKDWQADASGLRGCDLIIGCVDTFRGREQLEAFCRRYCIPYVDIGMDVTALRDGSHRMAGQVILSMPDGPCMHCLGFLTPELLNLEGRAYGDTGGRPQVIWLNGVLASAAVGAVVDLLTAKFGRRLPPIHLVFDGNQNALVEHPKLRFIDRSWCPHFGPEHIGSPRASAL